MRASEARTHDTVFICGVKFNLSFSEIAALSLPAVICKFPLPFLFFLFSPQIYKGKMEQLCLSVFCVIFDRSL